MMSFHNERQVRNPRKVYKCEACRKLITGEHLSVSGFHEDFYSYRIHHHCNSQVDKMCGHCDYNSHNCEQDRFQCYWDNMLNPHDGWWDTQTGGEK